MKVKSLYGILFIVLCTLGIFCVDAQQAVTMRRASFDTLSTNRAQVLDTVVVKKSEVEIADSLFAKYESLASKGTTGDALYKVINSCCASYINVLNDPSLSSSYLSAKRRLRTLFPRLQEGGVFYSQKGNNPMAMEMLEKYIMIPKHPLFKDELFSFVSNYPDLVFYVASSKYNSRDFKATIELLNEYLDTHSKTYEQQAYLILSKAYGYTNQGEHQIYTLMKGVQKYPKDAKLHKDIIEYHINTRNASQAEYNLINYEALGASQFELLSIKARIAEIKEDFRSCMMLSEQLYTLDTTNFNSIVLYGRACYNFVVDEMKKGKMDVKGRPFVELNPQLETAAKMFEQSIARKPKEKQYYDALIDTYLLLDRKDEAQTVAEKLGDLMGKPRVPVVATNDTIAQPVDSVNTVNHAANYVADRKPVSTMNSSETKVVQNNPSKKLVTSAGVPFFSSFALDYVEERLRTWLQKGPFEKMAEYEERTTGDALKNKKRELVNEARKKYIGMHQGSVASRVKGITIEGYDPDNEVYLIKYNLGHMLVRVPVKEQQAQNFLADWVQGKVRPTNPQFDVVGDSIVLSGMTFNSINSGLSFSYAMNERLRYEKVDVKVENVLYGGLEGIVDADNTGSNAGGVIIDNSTVVVGQDNTKKSDIDVDIPVLPDSLRNETTFALIISNENYDLADKVHYAIADGESFRNYCEKTLGIPKKNIEYISDASYFQMKAKIELFCSLLKEYGSSARAIVYYSGHGIPNYATQEAYFLAKDGIPTSMQAVIPINEFYQELAATGVNRIDVFLDCCFSGNAKSGNSIVSARGVAIKPRENAPLGNMVVLSACSGDETAFHYEEKHHGLFTYFLLKKLQETGGDVTMKELFDYVQSNVRRESLHNNRRYQTPNVKFSDSLSGMWETMKMR